MKSATTASSAYAPESATKDSPDVAPDYLHRVSRSDVRYATWVCFFAWVFAVYDFILFGTLLPRMGEHFNWAAQTQTTINTWVTFGTAIVALLMGPVVDRLGRRKGIIVAVAGAAICSGLTAAAGWVIGLSAGVGIVLLVVIRSLAGLGYSEQSINAVYLSELYAAVHTDERSARRRGLVYSLVQGGWPIGAMLTAALVTLLYPLGERIFGSGGGWMVSFIFAMFPAIVIAILGRRLVETPQFVSMAKIRSLQRSGNHDEARSFAVSFGLEHDRANNGIKAMFRGNIFRSTVGLSLSTFLNWFAIVIFAVLGTSVLSGSGSTAGKHIEFSSALQVLIISNLAGFLGYVFHGWVGDKIGRRNTVAIGWILGGISFFLMLQAPNGDFWKIVPLYSLGLFFLIGPYSANLFLIGESFPSHIRATAGALVNACGQLGAICAGFGLTYTLSQGGDWVSAALYWGVIPCSLSGLSILLARHVDPMSVR
ncbi:MFS transporter [Paraburkholderia steynii]|uniref:MFS transporter n=1 Tax=Paraburkholderia steynii TaxID=1245441 RepID=A0A4R0X4D1_9BURK|nr:MFS transporter [Paraburkholderia steynii]